MSKTAQIWNCVSWQCVKVKKSELTPKQVASVSCPTCGVAAGQRCVLHSGAMRSEPHVERKLAAIGAVEGSRANS